MTRRYGHESLITSISGQRHTVASNNNTRILSCSSDNSLRLWKIEASTQMVYRGKKSNMSMECCSMVSLQNFVSGDVTGAPYQVAKAVGEGCVAAISAATI